jgi:5'-3' exonuclease
MRESRVTNRSIRVHLLDGTYELFRTFYGAPGATAPDGKEVGATRALLRSLAAFIADEGVTHVAAAFDTVIESFRNELYDGYKTGAGIDPDLWAQFPLAERATRALGIVTWSMIDFEADDALAAGALCYSKDPRVERVLVCTPDKDLLQCVNERVVAFDRRKRELFDVEGATKRLGVPPESVPDFLALVGDTADGYPGVPRWGEKSAAAVLARFGHIEDIPDDPSKWDVTVRGKDALAKNLKEHRDDARLFKKLATLRTDVPLAETLDDLEWKGAHRAELEALCEELGEKRLLDRVTKFRD